MQFYAAKPFSADFIALVQKTVRRRLLKVFAKRGYIDRVDAETMQSYTHGGGFSVDACVRVGQQSRHGLERLLRFFARPPFAGQRIRIEGEQIIYRGLMSKLSISGRAGRHKHRWQASTRDRPNTAGTYHMNCGFTTPDPVAPAPLLQRTDSERTATLASDPCSDPTSDPKRRRLNK